MKRTFDQIAGSYNRFMEFWHLYREKPILEILSLTGNEIIADLGGGTGHLAKHLSPLCSKVYVVDESAEMLSKVKAIPNVYPVKQDIRGTEFEDNTFDVITMTDVLHHVPDHNVLMNEISRILKPGGKFLIYEFDHSALRAKILSFFESFVFGKLFYQRRENIEAVISETGFKRMHLSDKGYYFIGLWENE